jgi:hypothetical protein
MKFKTLLISVLLGNLSLSLAADVDDSLEMTVYHSSTCSCCLKWLEHVKQNGFKIKDVVTDDMQSIKAKHGVPQRLSSCHTAVLNGYVIEGHIPAGDIQKLLQAKPKIAGIAAPGMPMGSPGMEMGGRASPYQVVSFDSGNNWQIFASH